MGRLKHRTAPGWTYFVTTKTWQNRTVFQVPENARILIASMLWYRDDGAYLLHEFVIMPNHLHLILTPAGETTLEKTMMLIKGGTSHEIHRQRGIKIQIWASGFHEASIRDYGDYLRKVAYIRSNPIEAHLARDAEDWPRGAAGGAFRMDGVPQRIRNASSGAKAPVYAGSSDVGAKAPTPENTRTGRQPHEVSRRRTLPCTPPEEYLL